MSDFDSDSSSSIYTDDEEAHEEDLRQLKAVLEVDSCSNDRSVQSSSSTLLSQPSAAKDQLENIRTALAFNKLTEEKLCRLEKVLVSRLRECRLRLREIKETPWNQKTHKQLTFRYVYCGKPYFRDRDNFPPPDNIDTITMAKSGMYDFSDVGSVAGWTVKDKSEFLHQILKMSQKIKREQLESKLNDLRRKSKKNDSKDMQQEMIDLKKQIESVKVLPLNKDIVLPVDQEYDWDAVAVSLNHRHSPEEYRSLWKLYLHPSINKEPWDKAEHAKLHDLVLKNRLQDWDKIAAQLNTGRTGYQCFVYYRTNMGNNANGQKWTKEEEEYLRRLIEYYREEDYIPWGKVAASMENRTKIQIYNKYSRLMELRKGRFLPEEDAVLLTGVQKFGPNFRKVTKYLPGRSVAQLRTRYQILSNKTRTSIVWSIEEDRKLIQLMANQDSSQYINYAAITKFFPSKDRVQLRARYVTLVKWMKKHPDKDIANAPRRGARRLVHGKGHDDLNDALEKLKNRIKNEIDTKKSSKVTTDSSEDVIEHSIITTLINEHIQEEDYRKQCIINENDEIGDFAEKTPNTVNEINLRKLLILLKAQINKPKFESSPLAEQYPKLLEAEVGLNCFKIKSYSKKAPQRLLVDPNMTSPDIWGTNKITSAEYVLPPNYSTITGCRKLMALASKNPQEDTRGPSLYLYEKRNIYVKEQVSLFLERFTTLFLWPMLLSNEGPREETKSTPVHNARNIRMREILSTPLDVGAAIPKKIPNSSTVPGRIDLDLDTTINNKVVLKPLIGNDDYLVIGHSNLDEDEQDLDMES